MREKCPFCGAEVQIEVFDKTVRTAWSKPEKEGERDEKPRWTIGLVAV